MHTPLQFLMIAGNTVHTVDFEGTTRLLCICPTRELAESVTMGLAAQYQVTAKDANALEIDGITVPELAGEPLVAEEHEHDEWVSSAHSLEHEGQTLRVEVRTCAVAECSASQFRDNEGVWRNQP